MHPNSDAQSGIVESRTSYAFAHAQQLTAGPSHLPRCTSACRCYSGRSPPPTPSNYHSRDPGRGRGTGSAPGRALREGRRGSEEHEREVRGRGGDGGVGGRGAGPDGEAAQGGEGSCRVLSPRVTTASSGVRLSQEKAKRRSEEAASRTAALAPVFPLLLTRANELQAPPPAAEAGNQCASRSCPEGPPLTPARFSSRRTGRPANSASS